MSQASARLAPAPAAAPLTAHTTGFGRARSARMIGLRPLSSDWPRSGRGAPGLTARSTRSAPAQKPRPAPVIRTARQPGSAAARSTAADSAWVRAALSALRRSGRFRISVSTPASNLSKRTGWDETSASAVTGVLPRGSAFRDQLLVNPQHDDRADHRDDDAPDVEAGYPAHPKQAGEDEASDGGAEHAQHEVQDQPRAGPVEDLAGDEARDQPQNDPADNAHAPASLSCLS